jgi:hypothetical protein
MLLGLAILIFGCAKPTPRTAPPQSLVAQQFTPPEQVTQSGRVYKLIHKQIAPNGQAIYE